jgi:hypothetical protein
MKQSNFPGRKVARQLKAKGLDLESKESQLEIANARGIRTKKSRSEKGKRNG